MELKKYVPMAIYELSLLKTKYVDFKNAVIRDDLINEDGIIFLPLQIHLLPKVRCAITEDDYIFENVREWDECHVVFNIMDGIATGLYITNRGVQHCMDLCYMGTVDYLKHISHPEADKCQYQYETFNQEVMEWLKSLVRSIILNPKGIFKKDFFKKDTYFHLRQDKTDIQQDNTDIYYIIYKWWEKIQKDKIDFVNVMDDGTVFIANND